jgi:glycolate oxidase FAD binding subunit
LVALVETARQAAVEAEGSLIVTSAPIEVKQRIDVWGDAGTALPLMRRLKEQFDPRSTLNPGRFVGGL